jgi:phosphoserine aminotransferase
MNDSWQMLGLTDDFHLLILLGGGTPKFSMVR